jgi:undecaprenyl diphosphate synthase
MNNMLNKDNIPAHIAIIMDGNGRWAKLHRFPKIIGHKKGAASIREILKTCQELGVKYLTLYTFSTENWKRPQKEVMGLMRLFEEQLSLETKNLVKNNVRLNAIGRLGDLSEHVRIKLNKAIELTKDNTGVTLTLALSYGSRSEILDGVKKILGQIEEGLLKKEDISEEVFSNYLYTNGMPDPDLLIRTSGEMRVSNFLLWQISYAEIYITKKLWPEFKKRDLIKAIEEYQSRQRRFGI